MLYQVTMSPANAKPETVEYKGLDAAGAAREFFAFLRSAGMVPATLVAVSETGARVTLESLAA